MNGEQDDFITEEGCARTGRPCILALTNCGPNEAEQAEIKKWEQAVAERQQKLDDECQLIKQVITVMHSRMKALPDYLFNPVTICSDFYAAECGSKIKIMFVLGKLGETELFDKIQKIGDDCQKEYEFAKKFGIDAWLEHHELLQAAVDRERERPRE